MKRRFLSTRCVTRLTVLIIAFVVGATGQPSGNVATRFTKLISTQPTEHELELFTKNIQLNDFSELKPFLEVNSTVAEKARIREAFIWFSIHSAVFRSDLADFVIRELPVGDATVQARGALLALVSYARERDHQPIEAKVYKALARHRGIREAVPTPNSLDKQVREILDIQVQELPKVDSQGLVSAFQFSLADENRVPNADVAEVAWRKAMITSLCSPRLLHDLAADYESLNNLQQAMLQAHNRGEEVQQTEVALLRHLTHHARLWSNRFLLWNWDDKDLGGFDRVAAYRAESHLRHALRSARDFLGIEQSSRNRNRYLVERISKPRLR